MKKYILMVLCVVLIISSCKKETELKKSVFVDDPENPDLPAYSEWGYNTFGAYYDRVAFISNSSDVPAKVIVTNNVTSFILTGKKGVSDYYNYNSNKMSVTFQLSGFLPNDYHQLLTLNDSIFDLKNAAYRVMVTMDTTKYVASILSGSLEFKRIQNLVVDTKQVEVILSGYFEFKALINNIPITVSDGRFDVGVGTDNFYVY